MKKLLCLVVAMGFLNLIATRAQTVNFLPSNTYTATVPKGPGSYYFQVSTTTSCALGGTVANDNCPFRLSVSGFPCTSSQYIMDWELVSFTPFMSGLSNPMIEHPNGTLASNTPPCTSGFMICRTANFYYYGPGIYQFRLCVRCPAMTAPGVCATITYTVNPPVNTPPVVTLEDIIELTLPISNTERLDATISDPADALSVQWSQSGTNPMAITLPPDFNIPSGTPSTLSQLDVSQITKPGTYSYSVTASDSYLPPAVTTATETFIVKPAPSSLGISITPPGTAPDPNVLYTPVNNVPLNSQITGINVYNDKIRYQWSQIAGPTAIALPPAAYTANINDVPVSSSTFNVPPLNLNALAYGIYTLRLTVEDEYYAGSTITQDITFEVKPPQSNLDVTVNPASETTIDPYNNFTFSGEVTGINPNSDVIITYWRAENGNPASIALPHTMASPNAIPLNTTTFSQSVTMNQRITEGTYEFWFVAKDIFYNVGDSAKVKIIVKPGESTFALTIEPTPEKRVIKTPEGFIFNEGENPQNTPFSVKGRVTGISDKTDYVRTYWRMQYEPELPDQEEQLQPTLPHTASAMKNIDLGVTSDESEIVFNLGNCSAGTYTLHFVARDVFYNTADSVSTKIIVTKPVSIEPSVTFTPNGDGQNDIWFVKNIESFPFVGVKIINERGELIFETDSFSRLPERGWDGRRKDGKLATEGAYYYQFYDTRDQKIFNVGSFVLLR